MIEARIHVGAGRRECVGGRIVQVGVQAGRGGVFVVERSAQSEHLTVGEDGGVHLDARL